MPSKTTTKAILTRTYPYFFALFPILSLYDFNKDMSSFSYLVAPVLLTIISTTALFEIFKTLFKTPKKASLFVSFFMISFLSFGHFFEFSHDSVTKLFPSTNTMEYIYQTTYYFCVVFWLILLIIVYKALAKTKIRLEKINMLFLYTSIILVSIPLIDIGFYQTKNCLAPPQNENFNTPKSRGDFSDIYYIILDGYGRDDVLEKYFNFDNSSFTKNLEQKGFLVTNKSSANYPQTYLSISSSLNYEYIDSLLPNVDSSSSDRWALRSLIRDNQVYEFLDSLGYSFVVLPSIWSGTKNNLHEDYVLGRQLRGNEFNQLVIKLTPFGASLGQKIRFNQQRNITNFSFQNIPNIAAIQGPTFTYVHILIPHPPFLFDIDGGTVNNQGKQIDFHGLHYSQDPKDKEKYIQGYVSQLQYTSASILKAVDQIIANSDTPPVIILQSDHGPGSMLDWEDENKTNMHERMSILNAYYLPDKGKELLYNSITPVNSFRVVFNALFEADLELLEDKSYFARWSRPYDFIDVTDRLEEE